VVIGITLGVGRLSARVEHARVTLPERLAEIRETALYARVSTHVHDADKYLEDAKHYSGGALHALTAVGHVLLYAVIGLILAVIYHLEREELEAFAQSLAPRSLQGHAAPLVRAPRRRGARDHQASARSSPAATPCSLCRSFSSCGCRTCPR